jgi:DNA-binding NtrC family response regulator
MEQHGQIDNRKRHADLMDTTIVGVSAAMRRALALVERFGPTRLPVLILGPTGVGKELLAHAIHSASHRCGRLLPVNCAAIPRDLVEGQLFGHRRGAFSGAISDVVGYVEAANAGTLFLDELSSMAQEAQAKLLRVLEEGIVFRLGESVPRHVDVRFVAAMQSHLCDMSDVRNDIVHRLAGVVIELLPLRERIDDIVPLARHFASLHRRALHEGCTAMLLAHPWPGNVRELRYVMDRAAAVADGEPILREHVSEALRLGVRLSTDSSLAEADIDRRQLIDALALTDWDVESAANKLSIGRATLYRRLHSHGLSLKALKRSHQSSSNSFAQVPKR